QDIFNNAPGEAAAAPSAPEARPRAHFEDKPIAADLNARNGLNTPGKNGFEDRGIYHAADAMKSMYDMGDAPSCATCGAIMTRSGSCYRCMSCGNTSGC